MLYPSQVHVMKTRKFLPHSLPPISLSDNVNDKEIETVIENTNAVSSSDVLEPEIESVVTTREGQEEIGLDEKQETSKGMAALVLRLRNQITTQKVITIINYR